MKIAIIRSRFNTLSRIWKLLRIFMSHKETFNTPYQLTFIKITTNRFLDNKNTVKEKNM